MHARMRLAPRLLAVAFAAGTRVAWRDADAFDVPDGTCAGKTFARRGTRPETRGRRR